MIRPARVEARGWSWRHGGRRARAVDGLDLVIEPGERVLLLGASGSGKSTLLAALAGVLGGDDEGEEGGSLTVDGLHPAAARGRAGLVLQDPETQVVLQRVADDVAFGAENLGTPPEEVWRRAAAALDAVGLRLPPDASTSRLSGGQKQRLALAGVLAMGAGLLLLDEPTANLDPAGVREVRDAVVAAAAGATLVVVEHRVATWIDVVDRVVVLGERGRVVADGPPRAVLEAEGERLAALGVWVPGREPSVPALPDAPGPELLVTEGLVVGRDRRPLRAVPDLALAAGELVVLGAPNGSGKSTLALTAAGLLPPVDGAVIARPPLARGLRPEPARWRSRDLAARIGFVFQSPIHQFVTARVRDELDLAPRLAGRTPAERRAVVDRLLDALGLAALAEANPFTLSGGQQRRLAVGGVLAAAPALLVLDEPTFGQDARTWAALVALLAEAVASGSGVLAVTHDDRLVAGASRRLSLEPQRVAG